MATYKDRKKEAEFDQAEFQYIIDEGHDSDFLLEMATARCLRKFEFDVKHSGYYTDPVTGKARQFDVRGLKINSRNNRFCLSLECKNIRKNSQLLVSTTPRERGERYINYLERFGNHMTTGINIRVVDSPLYASGHVGRGVTQFARKNDGSNGFNYISGNDQVGEKWTQVISQLRDFASTKLDEIQNERTPTFLIPILVVSNDTLWAVGYNDDLEVEHDPRQVQNIDMLISSRFPVVHTSPDGEFNISHLHITTIDGLPGLLTEILDVRP